MTVSQDLLLELIQKVDDFVFDHDVFPNAILLSLDNIIVLAEMDRIEIKKNLPTIVSLIPVEDTLAFDLPLPVLLPVIATRLQRAKAIVLENKNL